MKEAQNNKVRQDTEGHLYHDGEVSKAAGWDEGHTDAAWW